MSYTEQYADYKWIKVKRFEDRDEGTYEDHYHRLRRHHEVETNFLINEVRKLAALLDEKQATIDAHDERAMERDERN